MICCLCPQLRQKVQHDKGHIPLDELVRDLLATACEFVLQFVRMSITQEFKLPLVAGLSHTLGNTGQGPTGHSQVRDKADLWDGILHLRCAFGPIT